MKQWKKVIFFSIILVLLVVALIFSSYFKGKEDNGENPTPTPTNSPVLSVIESDIAKVTIENASGSMIFSPGSGKDESGNETVEWKLLSPENLKYDPELISPHMSELIQIPANTVISTTGGKLSEYGLDKPTASVSVLLKSGITKKVIFGMKTVEMASYYVMLEGTDRICTTGSGSADSAMLKPLDILDRNILGDMTVQLAQELQFKRKKDNVSLTAQSNNDGTADGQTPSTWKIISPIKVDSNAEGFYPLLQQLTAITAASYVEIAPKDLSKYGLDKPLYEFTLKSADKSVHCILGGNPGFGQLYGYSDTIDAIFLCDTTQLTTIDKPFVELVNSFVHLVSIWELKAIDIDLGTQTIHCDVKDDQENQEESDFKVDGKDANVVDSEGDSYFRTFYQSIISIFLKGIDTDAKPVYNPTYTIKYTFVDSRASIVLGFVKRDELTYYFFKDNIYQGFYVSKDDFISTKAGDEGLIPTYDILKTAIDNQVDGVYK